MSTITQSVGRGVTNLNRGEVKLVQQLLNRHRPVPLRPVSDDGVVGTETISAIEEFQRRVVKLARPDGRVDPGGTTLRLLSAGGGTAAQLGAVAGIVPVAPLPAGYTYFSHPDAGQVTLKYAPNAVKMKPMAEYLLKSIVASCGMKGATLNSTLRSYHDQARITINDTYKRNPATVSKWYGADVLKACKEHLTDIQGFATWWKDYDTKRGRVSSKHLSNQALDVVPDGDRTKFVAKVRELIPLAGTGVKRIIPKGEMDEPVDHVEFTFEIT